MSPLSPRVTVVITTHNRVAELIHAIESCLIQDEPCEVLVYDDASTDGTSQTVATHFPAVRIVRSNTRSGYIALRNRGFREASGDIVVSIDDDAWFSSPHTLSEIVQAFDQQPQVGAFALAYVEPYSDRETMEPLARFSRIRNFIGCAHAIRRQIALDLGCYPELLVHQGEERDLTIRMIDHGFEIAYLDTPPIVHMYSLKRDQTRMNYYGYRNTILFCWMRIPFPECLFRAVSGTVRLLMHKFAFSTLVPAATALTAGWWGFFGFWSQRRPVTRATWKTYRSLPQHGPGACSPQQRQEFDDRVRDQTRTSAEILDRSSSNSVRTQV